MYQYQDQSILSRPAQFLYPIPTLKTSIDWYSCAPLVHRFGEPTLTISSIDSGHVSTLLVALVLVYALSHRVSFRFSIVDLADVITIAFLSCLLFDKISPLK